MSGSARRRPAAGVPRSTRAPGSGGRPGASTPETDVPVFVISVAAELTGLHPQTLRTYDRLGLVTPGRTGGGGRRYSWRDIETLREIAELTAAGIGLEGVRRILQLEHEVGALRRRCAELEEETAVHRLARDRAVQQAAQLAAELADQAGAPGHQRQNQNLPAVRPSIGTTGQAITVWRRGRI
jgi:MerR family transcriptional regulator/heat shock protein HspR